MKSECARAPGQWNFRAYGDRRTPFTEEDEFNLCKYIATILPYKETGGRTGNRIYMELIEAVSLFESYHAPSHSFLGPEFTRAEMGVETHLAVLAGAL